MKKLNLVLLPILTTLVVSCQKDHNPAFLVTVPITGITNTSASSGGTFDPAASAMIVNFKGIQWDTSPQFPNKWLTYLGSGTANFTSGLYGLFPDTRYYVRAFAGTDSFHIFYGDVLQLTTPYTPGKYTVSTPAGTGAPGFANGSGSAATFYYPSGVAEDNDGNIYVADFQNKAVRMITPSGMVSTLATLDGNPNDLVIDSAGNVYVAQANFKVSKIIPSGLVSVFAGSGRQAHVDGTGASASFYGTVTLAIDPAGDLYVGDISSFRKITPAGVVSTLTDYFKTLNSCQVIGVDMHFNLYESNGYIINKIDSGGTKTFLAGNGQQGDADGTGAAAFFGCLYELRVDASGNIYASDGGDNKIRMITPSGVVTTIAGTGANGARDGNSAIATFDIPVGLVLDNSGNIIVADNINNKIRRISPQ